MLFRIKLLALVLTFCVMVSAASSSTLSGDPIIFIHGVMASQIEERSEAKNDLTGNKCGRTGPTNWETKWLDLEKFAFDRECTYDILKLKYTGDESDNGAHMYEHNAAYRVRSVKGSKAANIGPVHTVDGLFRRLEREKGGKAWRRDDNLLFFSYLWISDPLHWELPGNAFDQLEEMIDDVRARHNNKRVTVITHSNGAVLFTNYMRYKRRQIEEANMKIMNESPEKIDSENLQWRHPDSYAKETFSNYLAVAPALGGSMNMISIYWGLMGAMESHHLPHAVRSFLPPLAQGLPGVNYLFPRAESHRGVNSLSCMIRNEETGRCYQYDEMMEFLEDMEGVVPPEVARHWQYASGVMSADEPEDLYPAIENLYVLYSIDLPCTAEYTVSHFPKDIDDITNVRVHISRHVGGDGTMVALNVKHYAEAFAKAAKDPNRCPNGCKVQQLPVAEKVSHASLVTSDDKHQMVSDWVLEHVDY